MSYLQYHGIAKWNEGYGQFVAEVGKELGMEGTIDNEEVLRRIKALMGLAKEVALAGVSKPDCWNSCGQCESFKEHAEEVLGGNYWRDE
jgi:hypothetical protein